MKRTALLLAISALPGLSFAAGSNTISFKGQVSSQTCKVSVNGDQANPLILLPTVSTSALNAANSTAGETAFTIALKDCTAPTTAAQNVNVVFASTNVSTSGNLLNTSGTAKNVALQLLKDPGGSAIPLSNGTATVPGLVLALNQTEASHDYAVRYISEAGAATTGSVGAQVQYSFSYL
ncbi:fimbrial protein [Pseudomonas syringae pv. theae ICMP 3923]|uniref:Type 1 fimbrial protein n=5 Tax=Pseudomonas syringae group TaxID=136849 RepID=A0A261WFH8_9PSED|nr:fimbrial protein [Pseudomonas syringae]OZI84692.1 type 1 fimbrial protein [Pseudomonas avellanae]ATV17975.1 type 1 fimbrial protein [Pseudomonas syringae pv. actinidiae]EPM58735.1 fimbrial protein [Pseudomonas syringae pv. actinidiae ICMP 19073]EPM58882.1 fimbrial protein [Pseudomonas syringae pv. actinidiae ICMP 19071]EPM70689.1 fimbrial protein [Pseudomonas syringae pv. theae ICMP 3923]